MSTNPTGIETLVVKIGTSLLSGPQGFDGAVLEGLIKDLAELKRTRKLQVLLVSSGAVGCGMMSLGLTARPKLLPMKQATAAVGQSKLMHYYEILFQTYGNGLTAAQVLLSADDLDDRTRYLNIRNTVQALFSLERVVPVVNENDSVSTAELTFGDNDTLAARVAAKIGADMLIILSDIDGLYDKNPVRYPSAKLVEQVSSVTAEIEAWADDSATQTTVGGMKTKLMAARIACAAGVAMVIANGRRPHIIPDVLAGRGPATRFGTALGAMPHRKRWIAFGRATRGTLVVDDGARRALIEQGRSLLPAGVSDVRGPFEMGAAVRVCDAGGRDIARGLVNYSSADIERIKGCKTADIERILGRKDFDEIIHRDNLVLLG